eukprot:5415495-Pleurochrysis_carterae.AAC.2
MRGVGILTLRLPQPTKSLLQVASNRHQRQATRASTLFLLCALLLATTFAFGLNLPSTFSHDKEHEHVRHASAVRAHAVSSQHSVCM